MSEATVNLLAQTVHMILDPAGALKSGSSRSKVAPTDRNACSRTGTPPLSRKGFELVDYVTSLC